MTTNFPNSIQDMDATRGTDNQPQNSPNHATHHQLEDDTIEAIQTKLGIDNSAVTTSIDYLLKSTSSVSPGHKHVSSEITDLAPISSSTGVADAGKLVKLNASGVLDNSFFTFTFGDGSDGDVTISSPTTLTKDMYYDNLTVNDVLTTSGFRIFVKGTLTGTGSIVHNGNNGSNATTTVGGAGGTATGSGVFKTIAGGKGGDTYQAGAGGGAGNIGSAGGNGGNGNMGYGGGLVGGAGGTVTKNLAQALGSLSFPTTTGMTITSAGALDWFKGASGGGGGGWDSSTGAGGGGGASGGFILILAKTWAGTFTISATGGNGGNAGGGSAGGGGGGNGGHAVVIYQTKSWTGSFTVTKGTKGTSNGSGGAAQDGTDGTSYEVNVLQLI